MFSLIITIISIALVAALAAATLYFGGDAMSKGDASARAAQIVLQGQQVLGAADLFHADNGRWPNSMEELVAQNYLKQVPAFLKLAQVRGTGVDYVASAHAQSEQVAWAMPVAGRPTFVLDNAVNADVCKLVNVKGRGDNGILKKASTHLATQCFGGAEANLTVVVTREARDLADVLSPEKVQQTGVPMTGGEVDVASAEWLVAPGARASGNPILNEPLKPVRTTITLEWDGSTSTYLRFTEAAPGSIDALNADVQGITGFNARAIVYEEGGRDAGVSDGYSAIDGIGYYTDDGEGVSMAPLIQTGGVFGLGRPGFPFLPYSSGVGTVVFEMTVPERTSFTHLYAELPPAGQTNASWCVTWVKSTGAEQGATWRGAATVGACS